MSSPVADITKHWWPNEPRVARVCSVVDGDTIKVLMPWTDGKLLKWPCRLYGINTPELRGGTDESKAQAQACKQLLSDKVLDKFVLLVFHDQADAFGRLLVTVYTGREDAVRLSMVPDDLENVCEWMLENGPGTVTFKND